MVGMFALGILCVVPDVTDAGSGTPADPFITGNASFFFPSSAAITSWHQDITPNLIKSGGWNFWHTNVGLPPTGYYIGFQSNGYVGVGTQQQGWVSRSAYFSLFGGTYSWGERRIIDGVHCGNGADAPTQGISCARVRTWSTGAKYRLLTDVIPITYAPWCPSNVSHCTVYVGSMMLSGSPSTATQIGAWSVLTPPNGPFQHTGNGYSSVESAANPTCGLGPAPKGTFVVPFKNTGSGSFTISGDAAVENAASRGRWYRDWVTWVIYYC